MVVRWFPPLLPAGSAGTVALEPLPADEDSPPLVQTRLAYRAPLVLGLVGLAAVVAVLAGTVGGNSHQSQPRSGRFRSLENKEASNVEVREVSIKTIGVQGVDSSDEQARVGKDNNEDREVVNAGDAVDRQPLHEQDDAGGRTHFNEEAVHRQPPREQDGKDGGALLDAQEAVGRQPPRKQDLSEQESEYSSSEWKVVCQGAASVREKPDIEAAILATKPAGTIVVGERSDNWLALINEPGFMAIESQDSHDKAAILQQRSVLYSRLLHGACKDVNKHPIWDADTCQNAGFALGYFDSKIGLYDGSDHQRPEGCYEFQGQLWVATNPVHRGNGALGERKPLCSSNAYPTTTTTTTTVTTTTVTATTVTTRTTSTTTTTWGSPSLFCIQVVRAHGYELPLVKAQQKVRASVFSCDEYRIFSDGGKTTVIGIAPDGEEIRTIVIPPIKKKKMALNLKAGVTTNSWLNTETFLQVWDLARKKDGRLLRHDWVIKVDPDAVFFPERLRSRLRPHTRRGAGMYVMNCDRYNPVALYGSLEIFSQEAMKTYLDKQWNCRNSLPWHGWGEDFYMSHCMDHLGVQRLYDFSLIGDKRCHYASCDVTSKAVYHDYKNQTAWFECWHLSRRTELIARR